MEPECSLQCSQVTATCFCPEPDESSLHSHTLLKYEFLCHGKYASRRFCYTMLCYYPREIICTVLL